MVEYLFLSTIVATSFIAINVILNAKQVIAHRLKRQLMQQWSDTVEATIWNVNDFCVFFRMILT